jgi:Tol biopolymer transport system component
MPPETTPPQQEQFIPYVPPDKTDSSKRNIFLVLIIIIVLIILGVGMFFYADSKTPSATTPVEVKEEVAKIAPAERLSKVIAKVPPNMFPIIDPDYFGMIAFSGNGKEVLYQAMSEDLKSSIVMKNNESLGELLVHGFSPSKDGSGINYVAMKRTGESYVVIINGEEQKDITETPSDSEIAFSADGKTYCYNSTKKGLLTVVCNGQHVYSGDVPRMVMAGKVSPNAYITLGPALRSDAGQVATVVQDGLKHKAVFIDLLSKDTKNIRTDASFDKILSRVVFSPDGSHYAYRARNGEAEFMVVDGVAQESFGPFSGVAWAPVFSFDGKKLLYTTRNSQPSKSLESTFAVMDVMSKKLVTYAKSEFPDTVDTIDPDVVADSFENFDPMILYKVSDRSGINTVTVVRDMGVLEDPAIESRIKEAGDNMFAQMKNYAGSQEIVCRSKWCTI